MSRSALFAEHNPDEAFVWMAKDEGEKGERGGAASFLF